MNLSAENSSLRPWPLARVSRETGIPPQRARQYDAELNTGWHQQTQYSRGWFRIICSTASIAAFCSEQLAVYSAHEGPSCKDAHLGFGSSQMTTSSASIRSYYYSNRLTVQCKPSRRNQFDTSSLGRNFSAEKRLSAAEDAALPDDLICYTSRSLGVGQR